MTSARNYSENQSKEIALNQHSTIIWLGGGLSDVISRRFSEAKPRIVSFGIEYAFPMQTIHVGAAISPISLAYPQPNHKPSKKGSVIEYGIFVKKFTYRPLSGHMSKIYWGLDLRYSSVLHEYYSGVKPLILTEALTSVMFRLGAHYSLDDLVLDLAFPIGFAIDRIYFEGTGAFARDRFTRIAIRPEVMLGYRF